MHQYRIDLKPRSSATRSQSVSTLRRLTGEMEKLKPELAVESSEPRAQLWIFAVPFGLVALLGLLVVEHATYEKQIENEGAAMLDRQIVELMDQSVSQRSLANLARRRQIAAAAQAETAGVPSHRFAASPYADQQIHLADQLAVLGKLDGSAAALLAAVDSHPQDVELRMAAIRARMRIRDYAGARKLSESGLQLAVNSKDRVMFQQLLKDMPTR
ncbi:MAG TPA: hypothetical protein V6D22_11970 [Candidatus Obscuribacterales bacterium]